MKTLLVKKSLLSLLIVTLLLAVACQKNIADNGIAHTGQSAVNVYLTDDPSLVFDKVLLDIRSLEIKVEDDDQQHHESEHQGDVDDHDHHGDTSGGWQTLSIRAGIYDILQFRNGLDTLFGTGLFPATHQLKKIRLTLGSNNSVVVNGGSIPLVLKGNDNIIVIKLDESAVSIHSGGTTHFWLDIDAGRSISRHGNDFEFKPSVHGFSKETTATIEGRVLPGDASAVVMAVNGTDTASAKPEREGEFKITGLKAGVYSVLYHATANNYRDTSIRNVTIQAKEDTKLATVTLHK